MTMSKAMFAGSISPTFMSGIMLTKNLGEELRKRRGWEIETFFGDLKHNQQYKRIRLRGLEKANLELNGKFLGKS